MKTNYIRIATDRTQAPGPVAVRDSHLIISPPAMRSKFWKTLALGVVFLLTISLCGASPVFAQSSEPTRIGGISPFYPPTNTGGYVAGEIITYIVAFDMEVTVTGTPQLKLTIGDKTRIANYSRIVRVSTSPVIRMPLFIYETAPSDRDDDGISVLPNAVSLNGGTIRDRNGNAVTLAYDYSLYNGYKVQRDIGLNQPPVAVADTASTNEDTPVLLDVLANDVDAEEYPLSVTAINGMTVDVGDLVDVAGGGMLTLTMDGALNFDPSGAFDDLRIGQSRPVTAAYGIADDLGETADGMVTITVTGVNDAPVVTGAPYVFTLAENRDGRTTPVPLGVISADDPDIGDTLRYAITTGNPQGGFTINPVSGAITYAGAGEDAEARATHTLMVRVTDSENAAANTEVTVEITNVNEGPVFASDAYVFTLAENRGGNIAPVAVGTVAVTDPEHDPIICTITAGDTTRFAIDQNSGAIRYTGAGEDFETPDGPPVYALTVTATAGGVSVTAPVTVTVTNVDEMPKFIGAPYAFDLAENRDGTITPVAVGTVTVTDPESEAIAYGITAGNTGLFSIDENSGAITYRGGGENFETPPPVYGLTVTATAGGVSVTAPVTVTVTDVNDPPVAVADTISTDEDTQLPIDVLANDTDAENDPLSVIAINGMTVDVGDLVDVAGGGMLTLTMDGALNFDPRGAFDDLRIGQSRPVTAAYQIMDDQNGTAESMMTITVTGVNDAPVFINAPYTFTLAENRDGRTAPVPLGVISAGDADTGDTLRYAITTGNPQGGFTINPVNGAITYAGAGEDAEARATHTLMVRVTDSENAAANTEVTVEITNVNEGPEFIGAPYAFDLAENRDGRATSVAVGTVTATDPERDGITYAITAGDTTRFAIDQNSGAIRYTGAGEDFETPDGPPVYALTVTATAGGVSVTAPVTVTVTNVDEAPEFIGGPYAFGLAENQNGSIVPIALGTVTVTDPESEAIAYGITAGNTGLFSIDENSGAITYRGGGENFETPPPVYGLTVTATAGGVSVTAPVTVTVTNVDEAPEFIGGPYAFGLAENQNGSIVPIALGTVTAADPESEAIAYGITAGNTGLFSIDENSGAITYRGGGENFETPPLVYGLTVTATAGGVSVTAPVTVTVTNVDEMPKFIGAPYAFDLAENRDGTITPVAVGTVTAADPESEAIAYGITAGNTGLFSIDENSGAITYRGGGENFETPPPVYGLTVTATAGGVSVTAPVTVTVTDVNDPPVAVADTISTDEDTQLPIDVLANDTDAENDPLSVIAINGMTVDVGDLVDVAGGGMLTLTIDGALNFDPRGAFDDLRIGQSRPVTAAYQIMDDQNGTAESMMTITVTGVNDAPVFINAPYTFTLAENRDGRTAPVPLGVISAGDADTGDTLRYAITTGNPQGGFTINPVNGAITYAGAGEDAEAQATHTLMVRVTDSENAADNAEVTVEITNVDEGPVFAPGSHVFELAENQDGRTTPVVVGTVTATDPEDQITYGITVGDTTRFRIDGASGIISYRGGGEDFEATGGPPGYALTITATAGGVSATASVTVTVINENEPPVFDPDSYAFEIAEHQDGRTTPVVLGTVTATDPEDQITYGITAGNTSRFDINENSGMIRYTGAGEDFEALGGPPAYDLTITATANGQSAMAPVTVTVTERNEAPVAVADTINTDEDTPMPVDVLANDTDAEDDALSVTAINGAAATVGVPVAVTGGGTLTRNADGRLTFDPNGAFEDLAQTARRDVTATCQISDSRGGVADGMIRITVTGVNDAPLAVDDDITVAEDGTATTLADGRTTSVRANDSDVDTASSALTVSRVTGPVNGILSLNPDGTFTYAHDGGETTSDRFTYRVNDGTADSAPATVRITVTPANDAPVAVDDAITVVEGGTAATLTDGRTTSVLANDRDADTAHNALTVSVVTAPDNGVRVEPGRHLHLRPRWRRDHE